MKFFASKLGLILSGIYLALFALSGAYALYLLMFHTEHSEFSGMFSILITLPWSIPWGAFMNSLGYIGWYERFSGTPVLYGIFALIGLLPPALLNAVLFYLAGKFLGSLFTKVRKN